MSKPKDGRQSGRRKLDTRKLSRAVVSSALSVGAAAGTAGVAAPAAQANTRSFCVSWHLHDLSAPAPWTCTDHTSHIMSAVAALDSSGFAVCAGVASSWSHQIHHMSNPAVLGYRCVPGGIGVRKVTCATGSGLDCFGVAGYAFEHNAERGTGTGLFAGVEKW